MAPQKITERIQPLYNKNVLPFDVGLTSPNEVHLISYYINKIQEDATDAGIYLLQNYST